MEESKGKFTRSAPARFEPPLSRLDLAQNEPLLINKWRSRGHRGYGTDLTRSAPARSEDSLIRRRLILGASLFSLLSDVVLPTALSIGLSLPAGAKEQSSTYYPDAPNEPAQKFLRRELPPDVDHGAGKHHGRSEKIKKPPGIESIQPDKSKETDSSEPGSTQSKKSEEAGSSGSGSFKERTGSGQEPYDPNLHKNDPGQRFIKRPLPPDIDNTKDGAAQHTSPSSTKSGSTKEKGKGVGTESGSTKAKKDKEATGSGATRLEKGTEPARAESGSTQSKKANGPSATESDASQAEKEKQPTASEYSVEPEHTPKKIGIGVDSKTYKLMNKGDWKSVAESLEKQTTSDQPTRNHAWLAFAYMFNVQTDKLDELQKRVNKEKVPDELSGYKLVIDAFDLIAHGKPDEAEKTLAALPKRHVNDAFINFALAAVAGKQGKAGAAAEYCKRAVELDPGFAWGYRTLGYLEDRWLNMPGYAEQSFEKALDLEPDQGEVREMLINNHLMRNDFDGAIDIAVAGIQRNKKDGKGHFRLAQIYIQQWRLREALNELDKSIALDAENPSYYRSRATIRRYQGDLKDAIADQRKAVDLSKDKAFEMSELANMYAQDGDSKTAIEILQDAIKLDPANKAVSKNYVALLLKERRYNDLVDEYKRALKLYPQDAALHFSLAETLLTVGNDEEAIEEYKEAANLDQKDPRAHRRLAAVYMGKGDYDEAIKSLRRSLNIQATSVGDLFRLGLCYAQAGTFLQSEAAFVTALALQQLQGNSSPDDPKREDIIRSLASLLVAEGRYSDAQAQFQTVFSITRESPRGPSDNFLLKQSQLLADRKEASASELIKAFDALPQEIRENYRHMLVQTLLRVAKPDLALREMEAVSDEKMETDQRWLAFKSRAIRLRGDYPRSRQLIDEAINRVGDSEGNQALVAELLVEKARIVYGEKQYKEAEDCAKKALEKVDKLPSAYLVLGQTKLSEAEPNAAIDFARKALEQNPYLTDAYILIGDAYLKKGSAKDAVENYKKALEIYPGLIDVHKALLRGYKALALNDEIKKEEQQISGMEKTQ